MSAGETGDGAEQRRAEGGSDFPRRPWIRGADSAINGRHAKHSTVSDLALLGFIQRSIRSVWALQLLLLMRETPARLWSSSELVGELRASEAVVSGVLAGFERDGLVARGPADRVRFAPRIQQIDDLCDALAQAYRERPVTVVNAIVSNEGLAKLAEAFRLGDRRT
ncbi:MAG TPA: hypothetical protein VGG29_18145 [Caulobacteraceae bacterium]